MRTNWEPGRAARVWISDRANEDVIGWIALSLLFSEGVRSAKRHLYPTTALSSSGRGAPGRDRQSAARKSSQQKVEIAKKHTHRLSSFE